MSKKLLAALFATSLSAIAFTSAPADASERWRYEAGKRQHKQVELIREGRYRGLLTWREIRRLKAEQIRIAHMRRSFMADGRLDWRERQALRYAQDAATHHIFAERNNANTRHWWR